MGQKFIKEVFISLNKWITIRIVISINVIKNKIFFKFGDFKFFFIRRENIK